MTNRTSHSLYVDVSRSAGPRRRGPAGHQGPGAGLQAQSDWGWGLDVGGEDINQ